MVQTDPEALEQLFLGRFRREGDIDWKADLPFSLAVSDH